MVQNDFIAVYHDDSFFKLGLPANKNEQDIF